MRLYDYDASGNCFKVRLLLALLGTDYERVPVDIFAGGTLTPEFAELNPVRETPVLETDDGSVLAQSNAILWYSAKAPATCLKRHTTRRGGPVALLRAGARHVGDRKRPLPHHDRAWSRVVPARLALGKTALEALDSRLEERRTWSATGARSRISPTTRTPTWLLTRATTSAPPGRRTLARARRGRARLRRRPRALSGERARGPKQVDLRRLTPGSPGVILGR